MAARLRLSPAVDLDDLRLLAARIRLSATRMVGIMGFGYLAQALSAADIYAALFGGGLFRAKHDRFVLSPGHYAVVLYATAAEFGWIEKTQLESYGLDGALLEPISTERTPFVDLACGSLGQGLSGAIGFALAARLAREDRRTFAFLSDGEMEEGQVWEAAMFAAHNRLGNLTAIIDANNSQVDGPVSSVTTIEPLADKWRAFGWHVEEVDGHHMDALVGAFGVRVADVPVVVIARTDIFGRLKSLPRNVDGHFITLDPQLETSVIAELKATRV
jgi:transketolase